jgi:unsaturated rhamnogalacturonyl hydrolase
LEFFPADHPKRAAIAGVLERLAAAIAAVQDDGGAFWQILDQPFKKKNYREASASAMFAYALKKGVDQGLLDEKKYGPVAERAYRALFDYFVALDAEGRVELKHVCKVAGLGGDPYRDGSYEYYTSTEVVANDPKGIGALIMANVVFEGS